MKVRITLNLELPEECREFSDPELRQVLYESVVRLPHLEHLNCALELASVVTGNDREDAILTAAREEHLKWAGITDVPEWSMERL